LNAPGKNRSKALERTLLGVIEQLELTLASVASFPGRIVAAAKNSIPLKNLANAMGLLQVAAKVVTRFEKRMQVDEQHLPIYFLGEKLLSPAAWGSLYDSIKNKAITQSSIEKEELLELPDMQGPFAAILVSLYRSEAYLEDFAKNVLSQSIIQNCQLILISVDPTDVERQKLNSIFAGLPFTKLLFLEERIGIYEAWNLAIRNSTAPFITNMNVDDLRHPESLRIQVGDILTSGSDVVYQDVYYTLKHGLDWSSIESIGMRSRLPEVSTQTLARGINCPHNAPMWRRELHERIGMFDERFRSAGDHDFWIRASIAGATFYKSEHPHVSYFINPEGMSTKSDSPGRVEGAKILEKYRRYSI
jgi:hypothetical protein